MGFKGKLQNPRYFLHLSNESREWEAELSKLRLDGDKLHICKSKGGCEHQQIIREYEVDHNHVNCGYGSILANGHILKAVYKDD